MVSASEINFRHHPVFIERDGRGRVLEYSEDFDIQEKDSPYAGFLKSNIPLIWFRTTVA